MRLKQTLPIAILLLTACGPQATVEPARSTITPVPTFTSTPEVIVTAVDTVADSPPPPDTPTPMEPTATPEPPPDPPTPEPPSDPPTPEPPPDPPTPEPPSDPPTPEPPPDPPTPEPPPDPPTPTPPPTAPVSIVATPSTAPLLTVNQYVNVRQGPGTTHPIIEMTTNVQEFSITGKNPDGTWWQIDYNGQPGWVFGELGNAVNAGGVQVVANIPTPPPPPTPSPTPVPQTTPAPPSSGYLFKRAILSRCDPNAGATYVHGTVYQNSKEVNGYRVVFSWQPDGAVVADIPSGPHDDRPDWAPGYYSHSLQTDGPREGDWWFWIQDEAGNRISEMAHVHTHGEAGEGKCQQAIINFDS